MLWISVMMLIGALLYLLRPPRKTAPGPPVLPIIGSVGVNLYNFSKRHETFAKLGRQYGPVVQLVFPFTMRTLYVISDVDYAKQVLTSKDVFKGKGPVNILRSIMPMGLLGLNDGDLWRKHRRVMTAPLFNREYIESYLGIINQCSSDFLLALDKNNASSMDSVDIVKELKKVTLDVIMQLAFGYNSGMSLDGATPEFQMMFEKGDGAIGTGAFVQNIVPRFIWNMLPLKQKFDKSMGYLHGLVDHVLENGEAPSGSIIQALKNATDADSAEKLSSQELKDEALSILLAGHETLTNTLGWTVYLLAKKENKEVLDKLLQEVDSVLAGRTQFSMDDYERMPYAQQVILEALRIFPTVPMFGRYCFNGGYLNDTEILANSLVLISNSSLTKNEKLYPEPMRFDPERHEESIKIEKKRDFFPFGGGHRMCIGKRLAQVESVAILAKFLQCYSISEVPEFTPVPSSFVTLVSGNGISVKLTSRK